MREKIKFLSILFFSLFSVGDHLCLSQASWVPLGGPDAYNKYFFGFHSIYQDGKGNIYVPGGYNNRGIVSMWDGTNWSNLGGDTAFKIGSGISALHIDKNSNVYAIGGIWTKFGYNSVAKWDGKSWSELGGSSSLRASEIHSISSDTFGNVYVVTDTLRFGTTVPCLAKWDGKQWRRIMFPTLWYNSSIYGGFGNLLCDKTGNVFIFRVYLNTRDEQYIAKWDNKSWSLISDKLLDSASSNLILDNSGNFHIGGGGRISSNIDRPYVAKFDGTKWTEIRGVKNLSTPGNVSSININTLGNIYAGGNKIQNKKMIYAISKWNGTTWSEIGAGFDREIFSVLSNSNGSIYCTGDFYTSTGNRLIATWDSCQRISKQPLNTTINLYENAQFTVKSSKNALKYYWQVNSGGGFNYLKDSGQFKGTSNDTMIILNANKINNKQEFRCIVTDGLFCTDTTNIAVLTVNNCQKKINQQPKNQSVQVNTNAIFTISTSDSTAKFQWQTDLGTGLQNLNNVGQYSGVQNDTLVVANVSMTNNNQPFRCLVSSGLCTDTSDLVLLNVGNGVSTQYMSQNFHFKLHPNPALNDITITTDLQFADSRYEILSNTGKVLQHGVINPSGKTNLDISSFPKGIYVIKIGKNHARIFTIIGK